MTAVALDFPAVHRTRAARSTATVPERRRGEATRQLFAQIAASTDPRECDRLLGSVIETNMGVAQSIARRYLGRGERDDDLVQVAYLGLVKAAHGFDDSRGKDFLTYAVPTISGELKRHFRDHCWTVRPPRSIQELQARISANLEPLRWRRGAGPGGDPPAAHTAGT